MSVQAGNQQRPVWPIALASGALGVGIGGIGAGWYLSKSVIEPMGREVAEMRNIFKETMTMPLWRQILWRIRGYPEWHPHFGKGFIPRVLRIFKGGHEGMYKLAQYPHLTEKDDTKKWIIGGLGVGALGLGAYLLSKGKLRFGAKQVEEAAKAAEQSGKAVENIMRRTLTRQSIVGAPELAARTGAIEYGIESLVPYVATYQTIPLRHKIFHPIAAWRMRGAGKLVEQAQTAYQAGDVPRALKLMQKARGKVTKGAPVFMTTEKLPFSGAPLIVPKEYAGIAREQLISGIPHEVAAELKIRPSKVMQMLSPGWIERRKATLAKLETRLKNLRAQNAPEEQIQRVEQAIKRVRREIELAPKARELAIQAELELAPYMIYGAPIKLSHVIELMKRAHALNKIANELAMIHAMR